MTKPGPAKHVPNLAAAMWILSGLLGITAGVAIVVSGRFSHLSPAAEALIAVALGWLAMLAFTPWKHMERSIKSRNEIRELTDRLRDIDLDRHREPLRELQTDRRDEMGELSRAIFETLTCAAAHRIEARHLRRTMDHSIRRETQRATGHLQRQAATDPLTGLGNRRALDEQLQQLMSEAARQALPVTALVIDVDQFKQINDRLGHEVGDQCLAFLGKLLRSGLRGEDVAFRSGGDEFIVLVPGQPAEVGTTVAQRISSLFRQMPWPHAEPGQPSLSLGVASALLVDLGEPVELIRRADEAMYASKRAGRARITSYHELRGAA
ncbi:MAG: GGDEF domain-containing protein [Planctomycetota bacterium]